MFSKKIPHFATFIFIFSFIIRVAVCLFYNTVPISDFKTMYEAAQQTIHMDFSYNQDAYFQTWAYQTGFVLFEAFFLMIYNSIWTLKIVNCLFGAGNAVLIYKISVVLWKDENVAQITSAIYSVFAFHAVHVTVLSNSHASAFFFFFGIYLLLKSRDTEENRIKNHVLGGMCIAIGNIIRPEGIVFIVPVIALCVFKIFARCNKPAMLCCIKQMGAFLIVYTVLISCVSGIIKYTGVNSNGLSNQDPLWKFVLGLNYEGGGGWNDADSNVVAQRQEEYGGDRKKAELAIIKERTESLHELMDLSLRKIDTFWWNPGAIGWTVDGIWPKLYETVKMIQISEFWMMFCFSVIGLFQIRKVVRKEVEILLIPFLIFVNFVVYLFIEVQARYAYLTQIAIFLLAGGGMVFIRNKYDSLCFKFGKQKGGDEK